MLQLVAAYILTADSLEAFTQATPGEHSPQPTCVTNRSQLTTTDFLFHGRTRSLYLYRCVYSGIT